VKSPIFIAPGCEHKHTVMDPKSFDHIFLSYHPALCVYATGIVGDAHVAEDLVEDVFIKVLQRSMLKSPIEDWRAYLYLAVRNTCFKYLKRSLKFSPLELAGIEASEDSGDEFLHAEVFRQVMQAIEALPDKCGKVIRMSYLEEKSTPEIATALGVTESTVYNQKARGLSLLKKMLSGAAFYSFFYLN